MASWEEAIETGEVPESGSEFDAIVVGGGPGGCLRDARRVLGGVAREDRTTAQNPT